MAFNISKVAIIGAGPTGLASAKYLLAHRAFTSVTLFEQQPESALGGAWFYTPSAPPPPPAPQTDPFHPPDAPLRGGAGPGGEAGSDAAPVFMSAMYEDLHANIPGSLMEFKDAPFPADAPVFPSRQEIREYVLRYAEEVRHLIRFSREVVSVAPREAVTAGGHERWDVVSRSTLDGGEGGEEADTFDAVVIANGHYSVPSVPPIPGLAAYAAAHLASVLHSKQFRSARAFAGKNVVVVGNGPSGLDVARQIRPHAARLHLSVREPTPPQKLAHVGCPEVAAIAEFLPATRGVRLSDGGGGGGGGGSEIHDIDAIIFCTGYFYSFPFLPPSLSRSLVSGAGRGVHGLHRHLFSIAHPTLALPGLLVRAVPFPVAEAQAAVLSAAWANLIDLPPAHAMWEESRALDAERGDAVQVLPRMADAAYINEMHDWAAGCGEGREPPWWGPRRVWERGIYAEAKIRFEEGGCRARTLEELGFEPGEGEGGVEKGV